MEENSSFLSVKKNIKEKDIKKRHTKIKLNQKLNSSIQNIIIVILILIIIILCLVIGILLLTRDYSKINNNNYINYNDTNFEKEIINNKIELKTNSDKKLENKKKEKKDKKEEIEIKEEEEKEEEKEEKEEKDENKIISKKKPSTRKRLFQVKSDPIPKGKNQIHIAMAIDNHFVYPTLVSMASGLYNNNDKENVIVYHLLFSHNFNKDNFKVFDSLKKRYKFSLNYYIIPNFFQNFRRWVGSTDTVYYKMMLPLLFYDLERIIYLDADTLIFKDLYEMYNLPFNGNYVLGYPFHDSNKIDKYVNRSVYYINGGVILFNNKLIRKDNKDLELIRFTMDKNRELWFLEQDSINVIFFEKIGILPLKYGIYMYGTVDSFERSIQIRIRFKLNRTEVIEAIKDPSLVHFSCCNPKVWNRYSSNEFGVHEICKRFHNEFYFYANQTDYYDKIYNSYMK